MLLFGGLLVFVIVGILIEKFSDAYSDFDLLGQSMKILGALCLIVSLIAWPLNYSSTEAEVDRYHALKQSLDNARSAEASELERAAITQQIVEYNKDLASVKYWNETIFDIFISDDLAELEPIK